MSCKLKKQNKIEVGHFGYSNHERDNRMVAAILELSFSSLITQGLEVSAFNSRWLPTDVRRNLGLNTDIHGLGIITIITSVCKTDEAIVAFGDNSKKHWM